MFHRPKTEDRPDDKGGDVAPVVAAAKNQQAPAQPQRPAQAPAPQINELLKPSNNQENSERKIEEKKMSKEDQDRQQGRPIDVPGHAGGYVPGQAPRIPGAAYGASPFAGNQGGIYGASASKTAQGRRLVIGEGITMSGEIEACDYLVVEGTVEAALKGASVLEIAENGIFYGTVEIDEATVAGRFEGDITVNGRLTVTSSGSITGTIAYKELAVDAGATVDGKITPLAAKGGAGKKPETSSKPKAKEGRLLRPDNDDAGQLPFAGTAAE